MKRRDFEAVARGIRKGARTRDEAKRIAEAVANEIEGSRNASGFKRGKFVKFAVGTHVPNAQGEAIAIPTRERPAGY